jgi:hypothetical protein
VFIANILLLFCPLLQMLSSKDINFVGYTYKNFEIVNDHQLPGIGIYLPLSVDTFLSNLFTWASLLVISLNKLKST